MNKRNYYIGKKYGNIVVLSREMVKVGEYSNHYEEIYNCQCECGEIVQYPEWMLKNPVRRKKLACKPCRRDKRNKRFDHIKEKYNKPPFIHQFIKGTV